jgi:two-component sensor histidine kinase
VGTYDGGLNRIEGDRVTAIFRADVLGSDVVSALYEDADGVLWVGTYGGGLTRLEGGRAFRFTPRHGLFDDKIYQVLEDADGRLWMGCNKGVFRVDRADLNAVAAGHLSGVSSVVYDEDDGLRSREVMGGAQPAGWRGRDGRLWFPTTAGLAAVDPATLAHRGAAPPVVIEEVRVEREPVAARPEMALAPGVEHVEFAFAALTLADPEGVRYRFRLEGYEDTWSTPTDRRVASYTHLDPGHYTFHVQAMGTDGVWGSEGAAYAFRLRPFFWETAWFWLLVGLAGAGAGVGAYRARVRGLKRRQHELEEEVAARTRDLQAALDDREVLLREIHHRVKNNLQIVSSLLHLQAQKAGDDDTTALFREARARVHAMAMIHERLYRSDSLAALDFGAYLRSITEQLVRSYSVGDGVRLDVRADEAALSAEQAVPLGLVANELVSNALKHAFPDGHGRLLVLFERDARGTGAADGASAGAYRLAVEDDGPGLPAAFRPGQGPSLGLKLVQALAARLGGEVTSGPARESPTGTRFTLHFSASASAPNVPEPAAETLPVGPNGLVGSNGHAAEPSP